MWKPQQHLQYESIRMFAEAFLDSLQACSEGIVPDDICHNILIGSCAQAGR